MMSDTLIALYCVCDKVFQEKSILRFFAFHSYQSSDFCFRWNKSSFSAVSFLCETLNHVESKSHFRKLHFETTWATLARKFFPQYSNNIVILAFPDFWLKFWIKGLKRLCSVFHVISKTIPDIKEQIFVFPVSKSSTLHSWPLRMNV